MVDDGDYLEGGSPTRPEDHVSGSTPPGYDRTPGGGLQAMPSSPTSSRLGNDDLGF